MRIGSICDFLKTLYKRKRENYQSIFIKSRHDQVGFLFFKKKHKTQRKMMKTNLKHTINQNTRVQKRSKVFNFFQIRLKGLFNEAHFKALQ